MAYELTPEELASYGIRRRTATSQYGINKAQLDYNQALLEAQYGQQTGDLTKQWDQYRTRLPGGFAGRGLLNSGIYGQALQDYATNRGDAMSRALQNYQLQLGGVGVQNRAIEQGYADTLANLTEEEAARRATIAAQLRGVL